MLTRLYLFGFLLLTVCLAAVAIATPSTLPMTEGERKAQAAEALKHAGIVTVKPRDTVASRAVKDFIDGWNGKMHYLDHDSGQGRLVVRASAQMMTDAAKEPVLKDAVTEIGGKMRGFDAVMMLNRVCGVKTGADIDKTMFMIKKCQMKKDMKV